MFGALYPDTPRIRQNMSKLKNGDAEDATPRGQGGRATVPRGLMGQCILRENGAAPHRKGMCPAAKTLTTLVFLQLQRFTKGGRFAMQLLFEVSLKFKLGVE